MTTRETDELAQVVDRVLDEESAHDARSALAEIVRRARERDGLLGDGAEYILVNRERERAEAAERERDELIREVREWLCEECRIIYPGPPQPGVKCVLCPRCGGSAGPRSLMERRRVERERDNILAREEQMKADLYKAHVADVERIEAVERECDELADALRDLCEAAAPGSTKAGNQDLRESLLGANAVLAKRGT